VGCDIHGWVEAKVGNKWVAVAELKDRNRNYERFAALAGVRDYDETSIERPEGVPKDVSDTAKFHIDRWGVDGHSHSYLPLKKAAEIFDETGTLDEFDALYDYFDIELREDESIDNYRLVFWFDN